MELSHSLTLNEDALKEIPEAKKPIFIFEWLRFLDKVLVAAQKVSLIHFFILNCSILYYIGIHFSRTLKDARKN